MQLHKEDPLAVELTQAIQKGDVVALEALLRSHQGLATCIVVTPPDQPAGGKRSLLHIATDWPGHFPNVAATIATLAAAGANVNARTDGKVKETPLHWAASSNDVAALDALLDAGADIDAEGAVLGGGPPLSDAVGFGNWDCARRLVERGAKIAELWHAAGLGRIELMESLAEGKSRDDFTGALWCACWGGQRETAEFLLARDANINWIGWDKKTPLDAAATGAGKHLVDWLRQQGAKSTRELPA